MRVLQVHNNRDLVNIMETLTEETHEYLNTPSATLHSLEYTTIDLMSSIEFSEAMCVKLSSMLRYFRGNFNGNGNTITVCSNKPIVLFSSLYNSEIRDLKIHNVIGSRGLLLADDVNDTNIINVELTGNITIEDSIGGLCRTMSGGEMFDCRVNIKTKCETTRGENASETPVAFGGLVCNAFRGAKFRDCEISGNLHAEVAVGGLCATAVNVEVENCNFTNLTIEGNRELGLVIGRADKSNIVDNCILMDSKVIGSTYLGSVCGLSKDHLLVNDLFAESVILTPASTSFFVGGIVGKADKLTVVKSQLTANITANFIVAGICPDAREVTLKNTKVVGTLVCLGYYPMMHHVYELVKEDLLTSESAEISVIIENVESALVIKETANEGTLNPFKDGII
jgi:hypothetical protein